MLYLKKIEAKCIKQRKNDEKKTNKKNTKNFTKKEIGKLIMNHLSKNVTQDDRNIYSLANSFVFIQEYFVFWTATEIYMQNPVIHRLCIH